MKPKQKYLTSASFRTALEERLNRSAKEKGIDSMRLRRQVAFDRLLSHLFADRNSDLILKGGYALELQFNRARTTKDIDFSFRVEREGRWSGKGEPSPEVLQDFLQQHAAIDQHDFFDFIIGKAVLDLENAPYGGYRFPVEARMTGRLFIRFEVDIAAGDAWIEPHEKILLHNWLDFAGIPALEIPAISAEQQFAEKLHAYTLPRETPNSRVKDFVDLVLLTENKTLNKALLRKALVGTFKRRKTHDIPSSLPKPPESWKTPFSRMAAECGLPSEISTGFRLVREFYEAQFLNYDVSG